MPYTQGLLSSLPRLDDVHRRLEPDQRAAAESTQYAAGLRVRAALRVSHADLRSEPVPLYDFGAGHVARCFLYDERAKDQRPVDAPVAPIVAPGAAE